MNPSVPKPETPEPFANSFADAFLDEKQYPTIRWWERLSIKLKVRQFALVILLVGATIMVMFAVERSLLIEQGENLAEQLGNRVVSELETRVAMAESLTSSLANLGERLGTDVDAYMRIVPGMIDYEGQQTFIAGGGIWPEPRAFSPEIERRSFFWGREPDGNLKYFDDYNDPEGNGYHHEEWYIPATYYPDGQAFWSKSYVDPHSYQPMVTCTVPMMKDETVSGVATVDLNLQGLDVFLNESSKVLGGHLFLVDRNNKFLSFPDPQLVKKTYTDEMGNTTQDIINASELAQGNELFSPIASALEVINRRIVDEALKASPESLGLAHEIKQRSYQINKEEAQLTAAILADPLRAATAESNEITRLHLEKSVLFDEPVMVSIFHMPKTYWKLVVVTPMSEFTSVADVATMKVGFYVIGIELCGLIVMFLIVKKLYIKPLSLLTSEVVDISEGKNNIHQLLSDESRSELGQLAFEFNRRTGRLLHTMDQLQYSRDILEERVVDRTQELEKAMVSLNQEMEDRTKMEAQLIEAQKLESIGQLAAGIAHEINTPAQYVGDNTRYLKEEFKGILRVIDQYAQHLNPDGPSCTWDERTREIQKILDEVDFDFMVNEIPQAIDQSLEGINRITHIVQAMKDFSHPGSGTKEQVNLNDAIQSTATVCSNRWKYAADIDFVLDPSHHSIPCLLGEFNQVILNLIVNAADAIESHIGSKGGKGLIKVETVDCDTSYTIRVSDNGGGMPETVRMKVFDPFYTTKEVGKGTGQGLSISHDVIVNKHGGTIVCESEEGVGTTFIVSIPRDSSEETKVDAHSEHEAA